MTNISKEFKMLEEGLDIKVSNWENIKTFLWKQQLKIEELTKSRDNWKSKYRELKK